MNCTLKTLFIGFLLSLASISQAQDNNETFESLIGTQPSVEINLGSMMLGLLSSATEGEEDISAILSALDSIKVTVFELDNTKKIKSIRSKINNLANLKTSSGFEKLATVREEDSLVYVLAKMDNKNFKNLTVFALDDDDELVLIEIDGTILMSQLGDLMGHFGVDLDINGMKFKKQKEKEQ